MFVLLQRAIGLVEEFFLQNKTLGVLYTPTSDNLQFNYSIAQNAEGRALEGTLKLAILFESKKLLTIQNISAVDFLEEDEYSIAVACELVQETRPYVSWNTSSGCKLRVLSSVAGGWAYKILSEDTVQTATIYVTKTASDGTQTTTTVKLNGDEEYYHDGIRVSFSTTRATQFPRQQAIIAKYGIDSSFPFRYYGRSAGCNSFPVNVGYWKTKLLGDPTSFFNKYLFVPGNIDDCYQLTQGQKTALEPYENNKIFAGYANVQVVGDTIYMDSRLPTLPTIMISFDPGVVSYAKPPIQLNLSYRYLKDLKTGSYLLVVKAKNGDSAIMQTSLELQCGSYKAVVPSRFYGPEEELTFEFRTSSAGPCSLNGAQVIGNIEEVSWEPGVVYESAICDARFHHPVNDTHCFSGCGSDEKLLDFQCVPDCVTIYGEARPYYDVKQKVCVNYNQATNAGLNITTVPFGDQFAKLIIVCEHGEPQERTIALDVPCLCDAGYNQISRNETHLIFCVQNTYYSSPTFSDITGRNALAQFGKDFSESLSNIISIGDIFPSLPQKKLFLIVGCVVLGVLVVSVLLKMCGGMQLHKRVRQTPLSLSQTAERTTAE